MASDHHKNSKSIKCWSKPGAAFLVFVYQNFESIVFLWFNLQRQKKKISNMVPSPFDHLRTDPPQQAHKLYVLTVNINE